MTSKKRRASRAWMAEERRKSNAARAAGVEEGYRRGAEGAGSAVRVRDTEWGEGARFTIGAEPRVSYLAVPLHPPPDRAFVDCTDYTGQPVRCAYFRPVRRGWRDPTTKTVVEWLDWEYWG